MSHNNNGDKMRINIKYIDVSQRETSKNIKGYVSIYFLGIKIKRAEIKNEKNKKNKHSNIQNLLVKQLKTSLSDTIKGFKYLVNLLNIDKFKVELGINLDDPLLNAYIIAGINAILSMYLSQNIKKVNLENVDYLTFISNKKIFLNADITIKISVFKSIDAILKIIFLVIKSKIKK